MTKLADETLMLYADGLLDASQTQRLEQLLTEDPALRARLRVFSLTGRSLAALLQDHTESPVPKRLLDFVLSQKVKPPSIDSPHPAVLSALKERMHIWRFQGRTRLNLGLAASLLLIIGFGLGWLVRGDAGGKAMVLGDLIQLKKSHVVASAPLQTALDTLSSGSESVLAIEKIEDVRLIVNFTFRNEARDYCREYEITASPEHYVGVACRRGDQWFVEAQALIPSTAGSLHQTVLASGKSAVTEAVVGALLSGDPLAVNEEAAAISNGWKK